MYVADTGIIARKGLAAQSGILSVGGAMSAAPPWIGGFSTGIMNTTNVANINLISTAATSNEIELGNNTLGGFVKLQATPSDGGSVATNFKVLASGTERLRVENDATTVAGGLTVSGTTNLAQLQCGTLYSAGYLPSNHTFSSGFEMGIVPTVNFARFMIMSPTNSRSQIFWRACQRLTLQESNRRPRSTIRRRH